MSHTLFLPKTALNFWVGFLRQQFVTGYFRSNYLLHFCGSLIESFFKNEKPFIKVIELKLNSLQVVNSCILTGESGIEYNIEHLAGIKTFRDNDSNEYKVTIIFMRVPYQSTSQLKYLIVTQIVKLIIKSIKYIHRGIYIF